MIVSIERYRQETSSNWPHCPFCGAEIFGAESNETIDSATHPCRCLLWGGYVFTPGSVGYVIAGILREWPALLSFAMLAWATYILLVAES